MAEKAWHPAFVRYMNEIIEHKNYAGLAFKRKMDGTIQWLAPKESEIGKQRKVWAEEKAQNFGIKLEPGVYAKVMLKIHPTKEKPCQICGKVMSLRYVYLNASLIKSLNNTFGIDATHTDTIHDAYKKLQAQQISPQNALAFFNKKFATNQHNISDLAEYAEKKCASGETNLLGPGAMSNFPDRFDGFHSYNRCCRVHEDKGRHASNMKTYNKDRRAYEYWSDGNIQAANKFMKSHFFNGVSADHICPISLGFIHDPINLQTMSSGNNSAKRDRLDAKSVNKLIGIEKRTGKTCISWFSVCIWNKLKNGSINKKCNFDNYRSMLKQNMVNFMNVLHFIKTKTKNGGSFLVERLLKPHYDDFDYDYKFDKTGNIIECKPRRKTDATRKEIVRYERISFDAIVDFLEKENREMKPLISSKNYDNLNKISALIDKGEYNYAWDLLLETIESIQKDVILKFS